MEDVGWTAKEIARALPCPFCGQPPLMVTRYVDTGSGDGALGHRIECERHPAVTIRAFALGPHGYPQDGDPPSDAATRRKVLKAWNTRP